MSRAIEYQAFLIGLSLMTGIWLMMAYDTLRLLRLMIRHSSPGGGAGGFVLLDRSWSGYLPAAL